MRDMAREAWSPLQRPRPGITDFLYQRLITAAWERFVQGDPVAYGALRDVVERSWLRCRWGTADSTLMRRIRSPNRS